MTLLSRNGTNFPDLEVAAGTRTVAPSGDVRYDEAIDGGMESLTFEIPDSERLNYSNIWGKNLGRIELRVAAGETAAMQPGGKVWAGYIWKVGPSQDNKCKVYCEGGSMRMRRAYEDVMFRVDALGQWGERDDDDANGPNNLEMFTTSIERSKLKVVIGKEPYNYGSSAGFALVVTGAKARKITALMGKNINHEDWSWRIRQATAPVPNQDPGQMTQLGALIPLGAVNPNGHLIVRSSQTVANRILAKNAIFVDVMCTKTGGVTVGVARNCWLYQVRVYDRADTDDYYTTQVMEVLADLMGYDKSKIVDYTTPRVLPVFHDRSASLDGLADLMAVFQQGFWLVNLRNATTDKLELIFTRWGGANTKTWYTTMAELKGFDVEPSRELFNAQRVYYRTLSGRQRNIVVTADGVAGRPTDPFAGTEFALDKQPLYAPPIDIPDRQSNTDLALFVGDLSIKELAVDRGQGTVRLLSARETTDSPANEKPSCLMRAGDQLVVTDFPEAGAGSTPGSKTLRLYQKQGGDTGVDFFVDRKPASVARFLARREKQIARKGQ